MPFDNPLTITQSIQTQAGSPATPLLFSFSNQVDGTSSAIVDVTSFQSFFLTVSDSQANQASPGRPLSGVMFLRWAIDPAFSNIVAEVMLEFNSINQVISGIQKCGPTQVRGPMYGPYMQLLFRNGNGGASSMNGKLWGSAINTQRVIMRESAGETDYSFGKGTDNVALYASVNNLAASTNFSSSMRGVNGTATVQIITTIGHSSTSSRISLYPLLLGGPATNVPVFETLITAVGRNAYNFSGIQLPTRALYMLWENLDGTAGHLSDGTIAVVAETL